MNGTWNIRSNDGAMNGLEFARCTTAGGFGAVLVHAAPGNAMIEVIDAEDSLIARADLERRGEYSPMTLIEVDPPVMRRSEVWPTSALYGLPVLLAGGEVGILQGWQHAEDHSWWRWSVEFSNHTGRPADWAPPKHQARHG
jgi:hypothetical protein